MDVPRERVAAAARTRLVIEDEGAERFTRLDAMHAPRLGRVARFLVVIAAHERELQAAACAAPFVESPEGARGAPLLAMQEIPEEDDPRGARLVERAAETLDVLRSGARRKRNPRAAKARGLSQMEVRHEERFLRGPEHGPLGEEDQLLARDGAFDHGRSSWAPPGLKIAGAGSDSGAKSLPVALSYSSCMRRTRSASFSLVSFSRKRDTMIGNAKGEGLWVWRTSTGVAAMRRSPSVSRENSSWRSSTSRSACPSSGFEGSQRANTS